MPNHTFAAAILLALRGSVSATFRSCRHKRKSGKRHRDVSGPGEAAALSPGHPHTGHFLLPAYLAERLGTGDATRQGRQMPPAGALSPCFIGPDLIR